MYETAKLVDRSQARSGFLRHDPKHPESEDVLIERAIKLHPDDATLKTRSAANNYPSRFRK